MNINVLDQSGKTSGAVSLPSDWEIVNSVTLARVVRFIQQSSQASVAHTKDRGDVAGSGIKPWRQKGTGNARAGSRRSPLWRGGGITFGPRNTDSFSTRLPRKMRQAALQSILLQYATDGKLIIVDSLKIDQPKTKLAVALLSALSKKNDHILVVLNEDDATTNMAMGNIPSVTVIKLPQLNALNALSAKQIIITKEAIAALGASVDEKKAKPKAESPKPTKVKKEALA